MNIWVLLILLNIVNANTNVNNNSNIKLFIRNLFIRDQSFSSKVNLDFKYYSGTKTDDNKNKVLNALRIYNNLLSTDSQSNSFLYNIDNIVGYAWSGALVDNSGFAKNIISVFQDEVVNNGFPVSGYLEYIVDGDPQKSIGIIINSDGNLKNVQNAVKNWSKGKPFNSFTGIKSYNDKTINYLSTDNQKPIVNNIDTFDCDYYKVKSGDNIAKATGVDLKTLQGYNPLFSTTPNTPICYTIGKPPDFRPKQNNDGSCYSYSIKKGDSCASLSATYFPLTNNDIESYNGLNCDNLASYSNICLTTGTSCQNPISDNLLFGYKNVNPKQDANKNKALDAIKYFRQQINSNPNSAVLDYHSDNLNAYMWIGQRVTNLNNILDALTNEIQTSSAPDYCYFEYAKSDPTISVGIVINVENDPDMPKKVVKLWSSGKSFTENTGKKYIPTQFCLLSFNKRFEYTSDVGQCDTFNFNDLNSLPLAKGVLTNYNPNINFNNIQKNTPLCLSVGKTPTTNVAPNSDGSCYSYTIQDGESCQSIANKFSPLTPNDIDNFNKGGYNWNGCNNIISGTVICLTKGQNCKTISDNLLFGYKNVNPKLDSNKNKALDAVKYFKQQINANPDTAVFYYNSDNLNAYAWVGLKVYNINNILDALTNEFQTSSAPDYCYFEYAKSDPTISVGIVINVENDPEMPKKVVKLWSSGKSFTENTGKKYIPTQFCLLGYNKFFEYNVDLGQCNTFNFTDINNLPLDQNVISEYNDNIDLSEATAGQTLCESVGSFYPNTTITDNYCAFYTAPDDNQDCDSIVAIFKNITSQDIDNFNSQNLNYFGCDYIIKGDKICISKPNY